MAWAWDSSSRPLLTGSCSRPKGGCSSQSQKRLMPNWAILLGPSEAFCCVIIDQRRSVCAAAGRNRQLPRARSFFKHAGASLCVGVFAFCTSAASVCMWSLRRCQKAVDGIRIDGGQTHAAFCQGDPVLPWVLCQAPLTINFWPVVPFRWVPLSGRYSFEASATRTPSGLPERPRLHPSDGEIVPGNLRRVSHPPHCQQIVPEGANLSRLDRGLDVKLARGICGRHRMQPWRNFSLPSIFACRLPGRLVDSRTAVGVSHTNAAFDHMTTSGRKLSAQYSRNGMRFRGVDVRSNSTSVCPGGRDLLFAEAMKTLNTPSRATAATNPPHTPQLVQC
jgi:hypothetical protein